jgi:hypothetical protein
VFVPQLLWLPRCFRQHVVKESLRCSYALRATTPCAGKAAGTLRVGTTSSGPYAPTQATKRRPAFRYWVTLRRRGLAVLVQDGRAPSGNFCGRQPMHLVWQRDGRGGDDGRGRAFIGESARHGEGPVRLGGAALFVRGVPVNIGRPWTPICASTPAFLFQPAPQISAQALAHVAPLATTVSTLLSLIHFAKSSAPAMLPPGELSEIRRAPRLKTPSGRVSFQALNAWASAKAMLPLA